jgi:hypothetical protein
MRLWTAPLLGLCIPGEDPVRSVQEAGWAWGRSGRVRNISPSPGYDSPTVHPVASRCTDSAIQVSVTIQRKNGELFGIKNYASFCGY